MHSIKTRKSLISYLKNILENYRITKFKLYYNGLCFYTKNNDNLSDFAMWNIGGKTIEFAYCCENNLLLKRELEYILMNFIVAYDVLEKYHSLDAPNNCLRQDVFSQKDYLFHDVTLCIDLFRRTGESFVILEILVDINTTNLNSFTRNLKNTLRDTDTVYVPYTDTNEIYILLRNTCIDGGNIVKTKVLSLTDKIKVGIAQWDSQYTIYDLFEEVENSLYVVEEEELNFKKDLTDTLDRLLNKSILNNDCITIVKNHECRGDLHKYIILKFERNNTEFAVMLNCFRDDEFSYIYKFDDVDVAQDILDKLP